MQRIEKSPTKKPMYVVEHGTDMFITQFLSSVFRIYDIKKQYEQKKIRKSLKEHLIWVGLNGYLRIRIVLWMDKKPPKKREKPG